MVESIGKDKNTGFEGKITGTDCWGTNGECRFEITKFDENGKKETRWVSDINLEVIK